MNELRVGVLGLGFIGRVHLAGWAAAAERGLPVRVVAAADRSAERAAGALASLSAAPEIRVLSPDELLVAPDVDALSICTHTDTHVELALRALAAGKHVLVEKPVALASADVERLAAAARQSGLTVMPALCMRFWPAWRWLHDRVHDGSFGAVRSAVFRRLGSRPTWSRFYADTARSGGALFDLHLHDADFVRWCLGPPDSVTTFGTLDHPTTVYRYPTGPPHVLAEAAWDHDPAHPFRMHFTVAFERASADFELGRDPELRLAHLGRLAPVPLDPRTGWDLEIDHFARALLGEHSPGATLDDALALAHQLEAEHASLTAGGEPRELDPDPPSQAAGQSR